MNEDVFVVVIRAYNPKPWRTPETYHLIETALKEKYRQVISIQAKSCRQLKNELSELIKKNPSVFVFNIAEYINDDSKESIPALLEELKVAHLGSSVKTIDAGLDKAETKKRLEQAGVATPPYFIADQLDSQKSIAGYITNAERIGYPLIIKPLSAGGHIGITESSIAKDCKDLSSLIKAIFVKYNQPALIEKYISGEEMREFSVGIIKNKHKIIYLPIEIDFEKMDVAVKILSTEAVQNDREKVKLISDQEVSKIVCDLSERTFDILDAQDYSRVDLRFNKTGYYVLEINIMPGIGPASFLPWAAEKLFDLEYNQLIHKLVDASIKRQN